MSRSRKHIPCVTDYGKNTRFAKREANKSVRNYPIEYIIVNGSSFKKLYDSWNIHDYKRINFVSQDEFESAYWNNYYTDYQQYCRIFTKK